MLRAATAQSNGNREWKKYLYAIISRKRGTDMEAIVQTQKLGKCYGRKWVLRNATFSVEKGEIVGLVGKNGAGKTTLIRLLTGIAKPSEGSFTLFGETNLSKNLGRVSARIEHPAIYNSRTGKDNLIAACILHGRLDADKSGYIQHQMEYVGLGRRYNSPRAAGNYSLGRKQRLGIAIARISKPELRILDEPTNGLDPEGIRQIRELLLKRNKEQKTTRIISSHILSELSKFATSYLFIDKGQLLEKISATSLENSSHHRYIISTNDNKKARQLRLDKGYSVTETSDALDIYNVNDQTEFLNLLIQNQLLLTRFESKENGLEDHFLRLIGDRK